MFINKNRILFNQFIHSVGKPSRWWKIWQINHANIVMSAPTVQEISLKPQSNNTVTGSTYPTGCTVVPFSLVNPSVYIYI